MHKSINLHIQYHIYNNLIHFLMKKRISVTLFLFLFGSVFLYSQTLNSNGRSTSYLPKSILPEKADKPNLMQTLSGSDRDDPSDKQLIADDLIVQGKLAAGNGSPTSPDFNFKTILLTDNNIRIHFDDNSVGGFPANDWAIVINESGVGGKNYFAVQDVTAGVIPFTIIADAPENSIYVDSYGKVGFKTSTPAQELHSRDGDTPTLRFEQDGSYGWTPQTWDMAGNESNFFIRDVTNGSHLPFRIVPGAPTNSLYIFSNGNVGIGTNTPDVRLHVAGSIKTDELVKITALGSLPASPEEGDICMDGTVHKLKYFDGTSWKNIEENSDEQDLTSATLTGSTLQINIQNGASVSVDLSPLLADLEARVSALEAVTGIINQPELQVKLFQNIPNPSGGNTFIPYFIPLSCGDAVIIIYDLRGTVVKEYNLQEKGRDAYISVSLGELKAGNYYYTLIVDGTKVDTKSMSIIE